MHLVFVLAAALSALAPQPTPAPQKTTAALAREARAAYDAGDKAGFLRLTEEIAARRPGDVYVLYNLACGQALNGQTDAAVKSLEGIAARGAVADLDADADFDSIRPSDGYKKVRDQMAALRTQKVASGVVTAFTIPEKGLVPEGVAYDPKTKSFFVSSIRKRKIVRVDANGKVSDFVKPAEGGLALGLRDRRGPEAAGALGRERGDAAHGRVPEGRSAGERPLRVRSRHRQTAPRVPRAGLRAARGVRRPRPRTGRPRLR